MATLPTELRLPATRSSVQVQTLPRTGRRLRRPQHNFQVFFKPFQIQPFMIAPVLPGETMKNLLINGRMVSEPLDNKLCGWWFEQFFFYVKLRDLDDRANIENMLLTNAAYTPPASADGTSAYYSTASAGDANWVQQCVDRIVACYFRDQEEVDATGVNPVYGGMPQAKLNMDMWFENLKLESDAPESETALPGDYWPELPDHLSGFADAYTQWQQMQKLEMAPPTFEDYLRTFGIRPPPRSREELHIPELLRYVRNWHYPTNTVDPTTGTPSTALVAGVQERADKDRFFAEPGFVVGLAVARPKMYAKHQAGAMVNYLNDAFSWLPALLRPDPFTSLKEFAGSTGPIPSLTEDYWVDLADLFFSGDQFLNSNIGASSVQNLASVPRLATEVEFGGDGTSTPGPIKINSKYASDADIDSLFSSSAASATAIQFEGRVDMSVMTALEDTTP